MRYEPPAEVYDKLERNFTYHAPKDDQIERYEKLRVLAKELSQFLVENCPFSREQQLALGKVEESIMWANAAIARNES